MVLDWLKKRQVGTYPTAQYRAPKLKHLDIISATIRNESIGEFATLLWSYDIYDYNRMVIDVSISPDGSLIAFRLINSAEAFCCINREGKLLWKREEYCKPSFSSYGSLLIATGAGHTLIYRDGNPTDDLMDNYGNDAKISSDGSHILLGDYSGIKCFNRNRKGLWEYKTRDAIDHISISSDGSIIVAGGDHDSIIYCLDGDGKELWKYDTNGRIKHVKISSDGTYITAGSEGMDSRGHHTKGEIYFFNQRGLLLWKYIPKNNNLSGLDISPDGLFVVFSGIELNYLNRDGKLLWSHEFKERISNISISSNGRYIALGGYNLYLLQLKEKLLQSEKDKKIAEDGLKKEALEKLISFRIPGTIHHNTETEIKIDATNTFEGILDFLTLDFSDALKYFDIKEPMIEFPPLKSNMQISKSIKIKPLHEGNLSFSIQIKSTQGTIIKDMSILVGEAEKIVETIAAEPDLNVMDFVDGYTEAIESESQNNLPPELNPQETNIKVTSAIGYKGATILYKVKIENNTQKPIGDIRVYPHVPDVFLLKEKEKMITFIEPTSSQTVTFDIRPTGECGECNISGRINYYDMESRKRHDIELEVKPLSIICPMLRRKEINEEAWRELVTGFIKAEEMIPDVSIEGEVFFGLISEILKGMNLFVLSPGIKRSQQIFIGNCKFYGEGIKGLKYAAEIEVMGGPKKSKLILKVWAEKEDALTGFYHGLLDQIEKRIKVKEYIEDGIIQQNIQNIHYGDRIGNKFEGDVVAMHSNIGAAARKCPDCGREVKENETFCPGCGARVK